MIKINIKERYKGKLKIQQTLDGHYLILDHEDIDIVVIPDNNKIVTFPSDLIDDNIYNSQNRLFRFLIKKGVVDPESIKGGAVYNSLEGTIKTNDKINVIDVAIYSISKWMDEERPKFLYTKKAIEKEQERLLEPDEEDTTELGEIPHEERKGTLGLTYPSSNTQKYY